MAPELPRTVWSHILGQLTFKEASQVARVCRLWDQELQRRSVVDLRDCKQLFAARRCLCCHRHGEYQAQLILPASHSAQQVLREVRWGYEKVQLLGLGLTLDGLCTTFSFGLTTLRGLRHVELYNMAFTTYTQAPDGDVEDWYTFDLGCLAFAELETLVLHFDRILDPCESWHSLQGGWVRGLEDCQVSSVTVVSECGQPLRLRIPHPVLTFHIVTNNDLYLERPKGDKYISERYEGNVVQEGDAIEISDICILAASTPQCRIPSTRTRQVFSTSSANDKSSRVCITGNATPDKHYTNVLERWAPMYSNLAHAVDVPSLGWYVSGQRWQKRGPTVVAAWSG